MSLALAIIGDIVPPRQRSRYQGYFMAVFGASSVLGPVIGGVFSREESPLGLHGVRGVFLVNGPPRAPGFAVVLPGLHPPPERHGHPNRFARGPALGNS